MKLVAFKAQSDILISSDEVFIELKSGSQFSGYLNPTLNTETTMTLEIGGRGTRRFVIIRIEEVAAMGINCAWWSPKY